MKRNLILITIMILAVFGILLAGTLTLAKYSNKIALLCGEDLSNSCNVVQNSPYSYIINQTTSDGSNLKIPLTLLGIVFYAILFGLTYSVYAIEKKNKIASKKLQYTLFAIGVGGVIFSVWFTWIQAELIKAFCKYCLVSAVNTILLLILITILTFKKSNNKKHKKIKKYNL